MGEGSCKRQPSTVQAEQLKSILIQQSYCCQPSWNINGAPEKVANLLFLLWSLFPQFPIFPRLLLLLGKQRLCITNMLSLRVKTESPHISCSLITKPLSTGQKSNFTGRRVTQWFKDSIWAMQTNFCNILSLWLFEKPSYRWVQSSISFNMFVPTFLGSLETIRILSMLLDRREKFSSVSLPDTSLYRRSSLFKKQIKQENPSQHTEATLKQLFTATRTENQSHVSRIVP